jgi:hypothetical protein
MRLSNAFYQTERYIKDEVLREELAYRQSIGKIINYIELRGRTIPSSLPLSTAETNVLRAIEPRIRQEIEAGTRPLPSWLTGLVTRAKGKIPIPDALYKTFGAISRVAPVGIFAYNAFTVIQQEHTMDNYLTIISALPASLTQSTTFENIFNALLSVARIVASVVTIPWGLNIGFGANSYIPYVPVRTPDEQKSLDDFNNKLSLDIIALNQERNKVAKKAVMDALNDINSMTGGYSNGRASTMDSTECPVIRKEDIKGLIEYDASLHGLNDCGVVATILV